MSRKKNVRKSQRHEVFEIEIPIFGMYVECYLAKDFEELSQWASAEFDREVPEISEDEKLADGLCVDMLQAGLDGYVVIALKDFRRKLKENLVEAFGVLTHESLHAARSIMLSRGIPFDEDNDEMIAYLQEFIVEGIVKKLTQPEKED